jgi:hypothetical protein
MKTIRWFGLQWATVSFGTIQKLYALADFNRYKAAAKRAARIQGDAKQSIFSELPEVPPLGLP